MGIVNITQDMIDELNEKYTSYPFMFEYYSRDNTTVNIILKNKLGLTSYIINLDSPTLNEIKEFFKQKGITIHYNNTASCFWSSTYTE